MFKKKVASVSVLKPVTDSRALLKIGISLAQTSKYEINIIGFEAKNTPQPYNVRLHPLFGFHRLHPARLLAPTVVFRRLRHLRADIVIVNTHELLPAACLYKWLTGAKIVYDVQENYYRNIRYTGTYPPVVRLLLALMVRTVEKTCSRWVDHFLLAEQSYARDLRFVRNRHTVVENKTTIEPVRDGKKPTADPLVLLYSGTISVNYGIFDALHFFSEIKKQVPARLVIAGHCAKRSTLRKLMKTIEDQPDIRLIGGAAPVPHEDIVALMKQADFALLPYHLDLSIVRCIPTKIYECIALKLPMIIRPNPLWLRLCNGYAACYPCSFTDIDAGFSKVLLHKQYYTRGDQNDVLWQDERDKLLAVFDRL